MALRSTKGERARPGLLRPQWGVRGSLFAAFTVIAGMAILISAGAGMVLGHLGNTMLDLSARDIPRLAASLQLAAQSASLASQGPALVASRSEQGLNERARKIKETQAVTFEKLGEIIELDANKAVVAALGLHAANREEPRMLRCATVVILISFFCFAGDCFGQHAGGIERPSGTGAPNIGGYGTPSVPVIPAPGNPTGSNQGAVIPPSIEGPANSGGSRGSNVTGNTKGPSPDTGKTGAKRPENFFNNFDHLGPYPGYSGFNPSTYPGLKEKSGDYCPPNCPPGFFRLPHYEPMPVYSMKERMDEIERIRVGFKQTNTFRKSVEKMLTIVAKAWMIEVPWSTFIGDQGRRVIEKYVQDRVKDAITTMLVEAAAMQKEKHEALKPFWWDPWGPEKRAVVEASEREVDDAYGAASSQVVVQTQSGSEKSHFVYSPGNAHKQLEKIETTKRWPNQ